MSNTYIREAIPGGDANAWATFEQAQNHLAIGSMMSSLFVSGGVLYLGKGKIGINNESTKGSIEISADQSISVLGLVASCWAKIELAVPAGVPLLTITSIGGETTPTVIPTSFLNAYDGTKGGFYIDPTKRVPGLVWINAAGVPTLIYTGIDVNNILYALAPQFLLINDNYTITDISRSDLVISMTAINKTITFPNAIYNTGRKITVRKNNATITISVILATAGGNFYSNESPTGATTNHLWLNGDTVVFVSDGTSWLCIQDSRGKLQLTTLTTGTIDPTGTGITKCAAFESLPPGCILNIQIRFHATTAYRSLALWKDSGGTVPQICIASGAAGVIMQNTAGFTHDFAVVPVKLDASGDFYYNVNNADVDIVEFQGISFYTT